MAQLNEIDDPTPPASTTNDDGAARPTAPGAALPAGPAEPPGGNAGAESLARLASEVHGDVAQLRETITSMGDTMARAGSSETPPQGPMTYWDRFWQLAASGLFFMLVGSAFLCVAFFTMGHAHATFSFVLVVVGSAILLYGTGTQGMGQIDSLADSAKYKVGIAGGAGLLAFAIAIGIILYSSDMKQAFQIEKKYARLVLRSAKDGDLSNFHDYVPVLTTNDGTPIAALAHGKFIHAYLPYFERNDGTTVHVEGVLHYIGDEAKRNPALDPHKKIDDLPITINEKTLDKSDGSFDFPQIFSPEGISMQYASQINRRLFPG